MPVLQSARFPNLISTKGATIRTSEGGAEDFSNKYFTSENIENKYFTSIGTENK